MASHFSWENHSNEHVMGRYPKVEVEFPWNPAKSQDIPLQSQQVPRRFSYIFHKWGYPNSWMAYDGNSYVNRWFRGTLMTSETSTHPWGRGKLCHAAESHLAAWSAALKRWTHDPKPIWTKRSWDLWAYRPQMYGIIDISIHMIVFIDVNV